MCAGHRKGRTGIDGKLISFEGIDGSGKSTQMALLKRRLEALGHAVVVVREPGGTPLSEKIRDLLLNPGSSSMHARTETLLFSAARAQLVQEVIIPARQQGSIILCDRFADSTLAYQGYGRELPLDEIIPTQGLATSHLSPNLTVLLDLAVEEAEGRLQSAQPDRMERAGKAFMQRVREGYLKLAQADPDHWLVIDAAQETEHIAREIETYVVQKIVNRP